MLQGIKDEVRAHGLADAPPHDASSVDIDHEGHVQPALPGRDIGEVRHPELVRAVGLELALDVIQRAACSGIEDCGSYLPTPNGA